MSSYQVVRSTTVQAEPDRVHALVDDFHRWVEWSPWEGSDPELRRTHSGAASGEGARYAWEGNRKAGAGSMGITRSTPGQVDVLLEFRKPFRSTSDVTFTFVTVAAGTEVAWRMTGEHTGLYSLLGRVVSMDKLIGKDFERGLAQLKAAAEA